jgi:hypothetical protein
VILLFLLYSFFSIAQVVQDEVLTTSKNAFSLKAVCQKMVPHESPLIDITSGNEIDCMGTKVEAGKFCEKAMVQDPYYLRGHVDLDKKEIICHSGKKVIFKYQCAKLAAQSKCSRPPKVSCEEFRKKLAYRLDLVHASVTKNEKGISELNCYFESLPLNEKDGGTL